MTSTGLPPKTAQNVFFRNVTRNRAAIEAKILEKKNKPKPWTLNLKVALRPSGVLLVCAKFFKHCFFNVGLCACVFAGVLDRCSKGSGMKQCVMNCKACMFFSGHGFLLGFCSITSCVVMRSSM